MASLSFNLINLGGLNVGGNRVSFSFSPGTGAADVPSEKGELDLSLPFHQLSTHPDTLSLLSWHTSLSIFSGRQPELDELLAWADADKQVSVKVLDGGGGAGKSRLAAEFCRTLRAKGWSAGFADLTKNRTYRAAGSGAVIVVDYPEETLREVVEFLSALAKAEYSARLRVLLVTRCGLDYWRPLFDSARCNDIVDFASVRMRTLNQEDLYTIFTSTIEQAAGSLKTTPLPLSAEAFGAWTKLSPENTLPLFTMAAAVHAAIDPNDNVVKYSGREVVTALARRETQRLRGISEGLGVSPAALQQLSALATLAGGLERVDIDRLSKLPGTEWRENEVAALLRDSGMAVGGAVPAPKPDVLAAALASQYFSVTSEHAASLCWFCINLQSEADVPLNRLARILQDESLLCDGRASPIADVIIAGVRGNLARTAKLAAYFVRSDVPYSLLTLELEVWKELSALRPEPDLRQAAINNLAYCLMNLGQYAEAEEAIKRAIKMQEDHPDLHGPRTNLEFGINLANLSRLYYEAKNYDQAIGTANDAIRRLKPYAQSDFEEGLFQYSGAIALLGKAYVSSGKKKSGGLKLILEATRIAKTLMDENPNAYGGHYTSLLIDVSATKQNMGNLRGALQTLREVEAIVRDQIVRDPGRHEEGLARILNNKGSGLVGLKDFAGSVEAYAEAVDLFHSVNIVSNGISALLELQTTYSLVSSAVSLGDAQIIQGAALKFLQVLQRYAALVGDRAPQIYAASLLAKAYSVQSGVEDGFQRFKDSMKPYVLIDDGPEELRGLYEAASKSGTYPLGMKGLLEQ